MEWGVRADGAGRQEAAAGGALQAFLGSAGISTSGTMPEPQGHLCKARSVATHPAAGAGNLLSIQDSSLPALTNIRTKTEALPPLLSMANAPAPTRSAPIPVGFPRTRKLQRETLGLNKALPNTFRFAEEEGGRKLIILCYDHISAWY